jgi:hypothetical protein
VVEDRPLELLQLPTRIDAQLLDQRGAGIAVHVERVDLAAGAVQGQHQLGAEPLTQRVASRERTELGDKLRAAAAAEVCVDAILERR